MTSNEELTDLYGKPATYSEHKRFDTVRYHDEHGAARRGTIVWICAPTHERGMQYVIEPDHRGGFPDFVAVNDIIQG